MSSVPLQTPLSSFCLWPSSGHCLHGLPGYFYPLLIEEIITTSMALRLNFLTSFWSSVPECFYLLIRWLRKRRLTCIPNSILSFIHTHIYFFFLSISSSDGIFALETLVSSLFPPFLSFLSPSNFFFLDFIPVIPYNFIHFFPSLPSYHVASMVSTPCIASSVVFVFSNYSSVLPKTLVSLKSKPSQVSVFQC